MKQKKDIFTTSNGKSSCIACLWDNETTKEPEQAIAKALAREECALARSIYNKEYLQILNYGYRIK